jgi:hypothetical protein
MITESTPSGRARSVVDFRDTGRIVGDRDDLPQTRPLDDCFQITQLLLEAVYSACGFVRRAKAQEIEGHDAPPASYQARDAAFIFVNSDGCGASGTYGAEWLLVAAACFAPTTLRQRTEGCLQHFANVKITVYMTVAGARRFQ